MELTNSHGITIAHYFWDKTKIVYFADDGYFKCFNFKSSTVSRAPLAEKDKACSIVPEFYKFLNNPIEVRRGCLFYNSMRMRTITLKGINYLISKGFKSCAKNVEYIFFADEDEPGLREALEVVYKNKEYSVPFNKQSITTVLHGIWDIDEEVI